MYIHSCIYVLNYVDIHPKTRCTLLLHNQILPKKLLYTNINKSIKYITRSKIPSNSATNRRHFHCGKVNLIFIESSPSNLHIFKMGIEEGAEGGRPPPTPPEMENLRDIPSIGFAYSGTVFWRATVLVPQSHNPASTSPAEGRGRLGGSPSTETNLWHSFRLPAIKAIRQNLPQSFTLK